MSQLKIQENGDIVDQLNDLIDDHSNDRDYLNTPKTDEQVTPLIMLCSIIQSNWFLSEPILRLVNNPLVNVGAVATGILRPETSIMPERMEGIYGTALQIIVESLYFLISNEVFLRSSDDLGVLEVIGRAIISSPYPNLEYRSPYIRPVTYILARIPAVDNLHRLIVKRLMAAIFNRRTIPELHLDEGGSEEDTNGYNTVMFFCEKKYSDIVGWILDAQLPFDLYHHARNNKNVLELACENRMFSAMEAIIFAYNISAIPREQLFAEYGSAERINVLLIRYRQEYVGQSGILARMRRIKTFIERGLSQLRGRIDAEIPPVEASQMVFVGDDEDDILPRTVVWNEDVVVPEELPMALASVVADEQRSSSHNTPEAEEIEYTVGLRRPERRVGGRRRTLRRYRRC